MPGMIHTGIDQGDIDNLKLLFANPDNLTCVDGDGHTPFLKAIAECWGKYHENELKVIKWFLSDDFITFLRQTHGENYIFDFNQKDNNGNSALAIASNILSPDCVKLLLADKQRRFIGQINQLNANDESPLYKAFTTKIYVSYYGRDPIVALILLEAGADIRLKPEKLQRAAEHEKVRDVYTVFSQYHDPKTTKIDKAEWAAHISRLYVDNNFPEIGFRYVSEAVEGNNPAGMWNLHLYYRHDGNCVVPGIPKDYYQAAYWLNSVYLLDTSEFRANSVRELERIANVTLVPAAVVTTPVAEVKETPLPQNSDPENQKKGREFARRCLAEIHHKLIFTNVATCTDNELNKAIKYFDDLEGNDKNDSELLAKHMALRSLRLQRAAALKKAPPAAAAAKKNGQSVTASKNEKADAAIKNGMLSDLQLLVAHGQENVAQNFEQFTELLKLAVAAHPNNASYQKAVCYWLDNFFDEIFGREDVLTSLFAQTQDYARENLAKILFVISHIEKTLSYKYYLLCQLQGPGLLYMLNHLFQFYFQFYSLLKDDPTFHDNRLLNLERCLAHESLKAKALAQLREDKSVAAKKLLYLHSDNRHDFLLSAQRNNVVAIYGYARFCLAQETPEGKRGLALLALFLLGTAGIQNSNEADLYLNYGMGHQELITKRDNIVRLLAKRADGLTEVAEVEEKSPFELIITSVNKTAAQWVSFLLKICESAKLQISQGDAYPFLMAAMNNMDALAKSYSLMMQDVFAKEVLSPQEKTNIRDVLTSVDHALSGVKYRKLAGSRWLESATRRSKEPAIQKMMQTLLQAAAVLTDSPSEDVASEDAGLEVANAGNLGSVPAYGTTSLRMYETSSSSRQSLSLANRDRRFDNDNTPPKPFG